MLGVGAFFPHLFCVIAMRFSLFPNIRRLSRDARGWCKKEKVGECGEEPSSIEVKVHVVSTDIEVKAA